MLNSFKVLHHHRGIGLIELLISMLIGLFIMAGVLQMFSTTSQNAVATSGSSRIQENIRFAFARLAQDISQSGNLGCMSAPIASRYPIGGGSKIKNILGFNALPVQSNSLYDFLTVAHGTVHDGTDVVGAAANTDVFRIRYFDNSVKFPVLTISAPNAITIDMTGSNADDLAANQIVGVSNCTNGTIFMLNADPDTTAGVVTITAGTPSSDAGVYNAVNDMELSSINASQSQYYLYGGSSGAYEYFIGSTAAGICNVSTAEQNCALFRRSNNTTEELVQGVHDMEVLYGATSLAGNLTYRTAAAVDAATDWSNVDRLKVSMTFNSIEVAQTQGNNIGGLLDKTVSRTFNLYNQL